MGEMSLMQTGGAGLGGALIGAIASLFGITKRMDQLEKDVVYKDTCATCKEAAKERDTALSERMDKFENRNEELHKETRSEIRKFLWGNGGSDE